MTERDQPVRGRGTWTNPADRFEALHYEPEHDEVPVDEEISGPSTEFFFDHAQSIITYNDSPDVDFDAGINPYRGCEHGCVSLLRKALLARNWEPQVLGMCGNTDPYQPAERRLRLTRGCLEILAEFRNPVGIITKNHLVTRDMDLLQELARHHAVFVMISINSLDRGLAGRMEPRTSAPHRRLEAIRRLSDAGVPAGLLLAPVVPGLNDHEIPAVVQAAADAGAVSAGHILVRLPHGVADLFVSWLRSHYPMSAEKVLHRIRELRAGRLNDSNFGSRMRGKGIYAEQIRRMFEIACRKAGLEGNRMPMLSTTSFRRVDGRQMELF